MTLDTNVIVSGVISSQGVPRRLLDAARDRRIVVITSRPLLDEVARTLRKNRIRRRYNLDLEDIKTVEEFIKANTLATPLTVIVQGVASHPEDDLILATALSGRADYLVTGDSQLQRLSGYQGLPVLSPRAFWALLNVAPDS